MNDEMKLVAALCPEERGLTLAERSDLQRRIFSSPSPRNTAATASPAGVVEMEWPDADRSGGWLQRPVLQLAVGVLALAGLAAIWTVVRADSMSSSLVPGGEPTPVSSGPPLGDEHLFDFAVSSAEKTSVAEIVRVDADQVCMSVTLGDAVSEGCFDAGTVSAGLAYGVIGDHGETRLAFGVVPDAVDTVLLDGASVEFAGNVWSAPLTRTGPADLQVGDSTADVWARVVIESAHVGVPQTTTTMAG